MASDQSPSVDCIDCIDCRSAIESHSVWPCSVPLPGVVVVVIDSVIWRHFNIIHWLRYLINSLTIQNSYFIGGLFNSCFVFWISGISTFGVKYLEYISPFASKNVMGETCKFELCDSSVIVFWWIPRCDVIFVQETGQSGIWRADHFKMHL